MIKQTDRWAVGHADPRYYQIAALLTLLVYGLARLGFDFRLGQVGVILTTVFLVQYAGTRAFALPAFEAKSALISGLSLCLLLRTNSFALAALTAAVAIASKFVVRWKDRHVFNPTNFALVFMMLITRGAVWVSPGQWGDFAFFGFLVLCLGGLVVNRASRADVALAFLVFYLALVFGRSFWLGEPVSIPLHRLSNGALLVFAFFMISDPRTTPDSRLGRILFALLVAVGAAFVQFRLFRTNGLLWSLACFSLIVPIINWLLPGKTYEWNEKELAGQLEGPENPALENRERPKSPGTGSPCFAPAKVLDSAGVNLTSSPSSGKPQ